MMEFEQQAYAARFSVDNLVLALSPPAAFDYPPVLIAEACIGGRAYDGWRYRRNSGKTLISGVRVPVSSPLKKP